LAGSRLVRAVVGAVLRGRARWHLARLDRLPAAAAQGHVLLDLVRRAGTTRFGRDHDFRRMRRVEDFRRLVPLRRPAELWQQYGQPLLPHLTDAARPGAKCANGQAQHAPPGVSPLLLAAHRQAAWTALAMVLGARPRARLFRGRILLVGSAAAAPGGLEDGVLRDTPALLRPYLLGPQPETGGDPLLRLARQAACLPVTCLVGEAGRVLQFCAHLRELTGRDRAVGVWPDLTAVLYLGAPPAPERARVAEAVGTAPGGDPVLHLETWFRPEGTLAVEDPRHGLPRLLPDHGLYFEFVPAAEADCVAPTRHGLGEAEPGVPYEIVLTSPAGWWACRTGLTVCFEHRDPPLLRQVEPVPASAPAREVMPTTRTDQPRAPHPVQPPHPRTAGTPAALPGTPFHSPWSAPAGRG
jgi:hypothetical protein